MALGMTVTKKSAEHVTSIVTLTGLTVGSRYDVCRLELLRNLDPEGLPVYERQRPDKKVFWSAVQHRTSWKAPSATVTFNDYETPLLPVQYFVVPTDSIGPFEYDFTGTDYPVTRGYLCPTVVDYWWDLIGTPAIRQGLVRVRSTAKASVWHDACVVEMGDIKYTARGTELAVMGSQYPVFVGDRRDQRRGSIVLKCDSLAELYELQDIVFPTNGVIRPIIFDSASEPALMVSRMVVIPLDVTVEQATATNAELRYLRIDFVEIDPTAPLWKKTAENIVTPADAHFTISDTTPKVLQPITLTDTSTGQYNAWKWSFPFALTGRTDPPPVIPEVGFPLFQPFPSSTKQGPHQIFFKKPGDYAIKLWVGDRDNEDDVNTGADSIVHWVKVHQ